MFKPTCKSYPRVIVVPHNPKNIELYNKALKVDETPFLSNKIVEVHHSDSKYFQIITSIECQNCHKKIYFNKFRRIKKMAYSHPALQLNQFAPKLIKFKFEYIERDNHGRTKEFKES